MKKLSTNAFSLVELLVVVTILAIIIAVGISLNDGYKEKTYNTKVVTDLTTIENTFLRYKQENGFIPTPEGNLKYFTNDGSYAHDQTEAYGLHGFITETTIPKKYIIVLPKDPKTQQYYAYGKTLNSGFFEVAGIVLYKDKFESVVKGNFDGRNILYNLIKEYNGPDFVYDNSLKNFPYNPEEMIMTAKISSFTGNLTLNNTITDKNTILERDLISGDNIKLSAGSTATIYYSDGTVSYLGDSINPLDMTLSEMKYKKENNLFTNIRIALNFGTILTKASKMSFDSNFNIYTIDTEASVRGTIFIISRLQGVDKTNVSVIKGEVSVSKITINNYDYLLNNLKNNIDLVTSPIYLSSLNGITLYNLDPSNIDNKIVIPSDQIDNVIEIKVVDGKEESILKEGKSLEILTNPTIGLVDVQCSETQHEENGGCVDNIASCIITNGIGQKTWNLDIKSRGDCNYSCNLNYKLEGGMCILNCESGKHEENGVCVDNIASCIITNGTGQKTWNLDIKSRGNCIYSCNLNYKLEGGMCILNCESGKHEENGVCVSNIASCIIINGTGQKTWNLDIKSRGNCICNGCNYNYILTSNVCVPKTRIECCTGLKLKAHWNTVQDITQTWNGTSRTPSKTGVYDLTPSTTSCVYKCNTGYSRNFTTKVCESCIAKTEIYTNLDKNLNCQDVCSGHADTPTCNTGTTDLSIAAPYEWLGILGCDYSRPGQVSHLGIFRDITYWKATCTCEKICQ